MTSPALDKDRWIYKLNLEWVTESKQLVREQGERKGENDRIKLAWSFRTKAEAKGGALEGR